MSNLVWKVETRIAAGKGAARKLRATGKLPAVAYGKGFEPVALAVDLKNIEDVIRVGNWAQSLINLEADGAPELNGKTFMIRELQRHHLSGDPLALDLTSIRMDQKIKVQVPLEMLNAQEVKKKDGVLEILQRSLEISCLPGAIPQSIQVDAGELDLGQTLHLKDISLPEGVEVDLPDDYPLCTVVVPKVVEEEKPAEEEEVEGEEAEAAEGEEEEKPAEAKDKEKSEEKEK